MEIIKGCHAIREIWLRAAMTGGSRGDAPVYTGLALPRIVPFSTVTIGVSLWASAADFLEAALFAEVVNLLPSLKGAVSGVVDFFSEE